MAELRPPDPAPAPTRAVRLAIVLLTLSLFGCDHATKIAAEATLARGPPVPLVAGVLELRYTINDDTAFSVLRTLGIERTPAPLLAVSAFALLLIALAWAINARRSASRVEHVGFALVVGGALGNVIDRALRGHVIDFIHLTRWPVFNVADIAVVAGVLVLVGCVLFARKSPAAATPPKAPPAPS